MQLGLRRRNRKDAASNPGRFTMHLPNGGHMCGDGAVRQRVLRRVSFLDAAAGVIVGIGGPALATNVDVNVDSASVIFKEGTTATAPRWCS